MHDLIARYFQGEITAEEKKELFSSMETDAALRKEFNDAQNLYALISWMPSTGDQSFGIDKLLSFKQTRLKRSVSIPFKHIIGYAASICIAVLSTWFLTVPKSEHVVEEMPVVTYEEFSTPAGQRAMVKLHDGTTVWLNARSTLRYPSQFSASERKVELDGEAFFEVSHNKEIPFVVATEKLDIKVLGTKFNVFAYKGRSEFNTSLVEGSVRVYDSRNESEAVVMKPNERLDLVGNKLVRRPFNNMDFLLWKEGIYAFDDVTFDEIVKKLELYYDIRILVKNPKLDAYKFSGKFRQRDGVESVLRTLQKVRNFSYVKDDERNQITIR